MSETLPTSIYSRKIEFGSDYAMIVHRLDDERFVFEEESMFRCIFGVRDAISKAENMVRNAIDEYVEFLHDDMPHIGHEPVMLAELLLQLFLDSNGIEAASVVTCRVGHLLRALCGGALHDLASRLA